MIALGNTQWKKCERRRFRQRKTSTKRTGGPSTYKLKKALVGAQGEHLHRRPRQRDAIGGDLAGPRIPGLISIIEVRPGGEEVNLRGDEGGGGNNDSGTEHNVERRKNPAIRRGRGPNEDYERKASGVPARTVKGQNLIESGQKS